MSTLTVAIPRSEAGARRQLARELMEEFVTATGVEGDSPPRRYLWTDAFAVTNLLGLLRESGDGRWLELALRLVDQVHRVLGRHRDDDPRRGWISGLSDAEGERHPTRGGLRIGKPLPERAAGERFDPQLEWERDGQYLHYLTQWMHALARVSRATGDPLFHRWAIELAEAAHRGFLRELSPGGPARLVWKMSIGLDRALVPSSGQHDALDAWLIALELQAEAPAGASAPGELDGEIATSSALALAGDWATADPLGLGALLVDAHRLARLVVRHGLAIEPLFARLVDSIELGMTAVVRPGTPDAPADQRLAFRELGLAIGLHAAQRLHALTAGRGEFTAAVSRFERYQPIALRIERFWSEPDHRRTASWTGHRDINTVMLATSLAPEGYLGDD